MANFDLESELSLITIPKMLKRAFLYHVNDNNVKITSKKDLEAKIEEFKKMKAGE